jgi:hypothetical protein
MHTLLLAALSGGGLVGLLIWLLVFALVIYVVYLILGMLPIPPTIKQIICLILGVIFLIVLLQQLGFLSGGL